MKIRFTLLDEENGHVKIDCTPPIPNLIKAHRAGDTTPALTYAILALKQLVTDSNNIESEINKAAREEEMMSSKIIRPWNPKLPDGPQIVH